MHRTRSFLALALLMAAPAAAQLSEYTAPGSLLARSTSKKEQMENALENARWRLGPLRVSPWLAVRDAAYVSDVFSGTIGEPEVPEVQEEPVPDFTITVGAGLQGFIPFGSKTFLTLDGLPQYVWWQEHEDRRRLNGYYGAGLFAFFNRLNAEVTLRRAEEQGVLTPEFEQRIHSRQDRIAATLELQIARSLFAFVAGDAVELDTLTEELDDDPRLPPFEQLDRQERVVRGGLEYRSGDRLRLAAGAERSEVDFAAEAGRDRSSSGTAPVAEVSYQGSRLQVEGSLAFRTLEPEPGSELVPVDDTTGQARATWTPRWRFSYTLYGSRDLDYSLVEGYSHFTVDRVGLAVSSKMGSSSAVNLFGEFGGNDYEVSGLVPPRHDDFTAYGTSIQLRFQERVNFTLGVVRTETDSDLPGLDQSLTTFHASVEVSAFGGAFTVK